MNERVRRETFFPLTSSLHVKELQLELCFSKCGPWTSIITWELLRNTNSGPNCRSTEFQMLGVGPSDLCFNKPSRWYWNMLQLENHWASSPTPFLSLWLLWLVSWRDAQLSPFRFLVSLLSPHPKSSSPQDTWIPNCSYLRKSTKSRL